MNRDELTDYILDFWVGWGIPEYDGDADQLHTEIYNNLGTLNGIESELDLVRIEFEVGFEEHSLEYANLTDLWDKINNYKSNFKESE